MAEVIERARDLYGYFVIVTSKKMSAKEALDFYKSRDATEKLFIGDKSYLGIRSLRAFRMDARSVKNRANELSGLLTGIGE